MRRLPAFVIATAATVGLAAPAPGAQAATNGPLAFGTGESLFLQPFDGPEIARADAGRVSTVAAFRDGRRLAYGAFDGRSVRLGLTTATGGAPRIVRLKGISINSVDVSPDGRLIAITAFRNSDSSAGSVFAYLVRADGTKLRTLKTKARFAVDMRFAPDGKSLLYVSPSSTPEEISDCTASIRRIRLDGTGDRALYTGTGGTQACPRRISLSPNGTSVAMEAVTSGEEPAGPGPASGVYRLSLKTRNATPKLLVPQALAPAWSPAGDQIAYTATRDRFDPETVPTGVFRIPAAGGTPVRVSDRFGASIAWLRGPA